MVIGIWQVIWFVFIAMGLGIALVKHGESKIGEKYNFWTTLISTGISFAILYFGGFFG